MRVGPSATKAATNRFVISNQESCGILSSDPEYSAWFFRHVFKLEESPRGCAPAGARHAAMAAAAQAELIHDVQLDYFGKQLATAGGDRRIKIYEVVNGEKSHQTAELVGHDGPVWRVAWAHPQFGNVLASCSYDRQVFVWREHSPQQWSLVHKFLGHEGSVNCISFGPRCARSPRIQLACTAP